jgi:small subunit ribosomal protein S1|uniref:Ribosomal protein S1 n=1 Tax=Thorea hispida TaxID=202687 RepID=A0A1C9CAM1_9FLOR|nr:ribosomal protein S1 [Thorea hispida]AOM65433.1 ribosomal protein S1 [Thorea hispida]
MYFNNNYYQYVLNKYKYLFQPGDIIAGTIFSKETTGYLVNIGAKYAAYLPNKEIKLDSDNSLNNSLLANTTCEFFIFNTNKKSHQLILSLKRLVYIKSWQRIKQLQYENTIIYTYIYGTNKGGILVKFENIQGFIPKSHIGYTKQNIELRNENICCKFLLVNEYKNKLIVSHKCALLEKNIEKIKVGYIIKAPITYIKPYGILVNIYNLPALLHISEINKEKITNLHQLFKIGETILVKVIHINIKQGKLLVSYLNLE